MSDKKNCVNKNNNDIGIIIMDKDSLKNSQGDEIEVISQYEDENGNLIIKLKTKK